MDIREEGLGTAQGFIWVSTRDLPAEFDLTRFGWQQLCANEGKGGLVLADARGLDAEGWTRLLGDHPLPQRRAMLVVGVDTPAERAMMLQTGFGDAVGSQIEAGEFVARARRLAETTEWLPRHRRIAGLTLDLLFREAFSQGIALDLNPREFALIWRLADTPDRPVSKEALIHDVWRMGFVPETNSIAVHMSRLRRKLALVGRSAMVRTVAAGGYCICSQPSEELDSAVRYAAPFRLARSYAGVDGVAA